MIRSFIVPSSGNRLEEWDYKSVEVIVAACYNRDENLLAYILDESTDMHRDMAADVFMKAPEDVDKNTERSLAKNAVVFPFFYGSYYEQIAPDLWERMTADTRAHLKKKGVDSYRDFEHHIRMIEEHFWGERFPGYAAWKKKTYREYERKGYVDLLTGFRCYGPMKRNEVTNYPIQGSAFHLLLWTLNNVIADTRGYDQSKIIGQIHDAGVGDIHPSDEAEFDYKMWYYGTQKIREHWDWIIVPLKIEKERSAIDGSWAEMEDCGYLDFGGEK